MSVSYIGTARDSSTGPVRTFNAQGIGSAAADRKIIFVVQGIAAANVTTISATVDGNAATLDKQSSQNIADYTLISAVFSYAIAAGTTANIVATTNVDMVDSYIHVYAGYGYGAAADSDAENNYGGGGAGATYDLSLDVAVGSLVIAAAIYRQNFTLTPPVWTGVTQDGSNDNTFDLLSTVASYIAAGIETPRTVSAAVVYDGGNRFAGVSIAYPLASGGAQVGDTEETANVTAAFSGSIGTAAALSLSLAATSAQSGPAGTVGALAVTANLTTLQAALKVARGLFFPTANVSTTQSARAAALARATFNAHLGTSFIGTGGTDSGLPEAHATLRVKRQSRVARLIRQIRGMRV